MFRINYFEPIELLDFLNRSLKDWRFLTFSVDFLFELIVVVSFYRVFLYYATKHPGDNK